MLIFSLDVVRHYWDFNPQFRVSRQLTAHLAHVWIPMHKEYAITYAILAILQ